MIAWQQFYEWHATDGPPAPVSVQIEAMGMQFSGVARDIDEALLPAVLKARDAVAAAVESFRTAGLIE